MAESVMVSTNKWNDGDEGSKTDRRTEKSAIHDVYKEIKAVGLNDLGLHHEQDGQLKPPVEGYFGCTGGLAKGGPLPFFSRCSGLYHRGGHSLRSGFPSVLVHAVAGHARISAMKISKGLSSNLFPITWASGLRVEKSTL
jgi:hypothetical protein